MSNDKNSKADGTTNETGNETSNGTGQLESELIGYVRRSNAGGALKINISANAFEKARRYMSQDGSEYVGLVVSLDKVRSVIEGDREVTSVCQLVEAA